MKPLLPLLALAVFAVNAQDTVSLTRKLTPDTTEKYKLVSTMNTVVELPNGLGEQEIKVTSEQTYDLKFGKLDKDKGLAVESTVTFDKMEAEGMPGGGGDMKPKPTTTKGWLDGTGKLTPDEKDSKLNPAKLLSGMDAAASISPFVEFPGKPVKVGKSWDVLIKKSAMMKTDQKMVCTLTGSREVGGVKAWVVAFEANLKIDSGTITIPKDDANPNPMAGQKMSIKADVKMKGEALVDPSNGQTIHMESNSKSQQMVELVELGMSVTSHLTVASTIDRVSK